MRMGVDETRRNDVPRGTLTTGSYASRSLMYTVDFQVYAPVGYEGLSDLPVIYVTDGHEYADDVMGSAGDAVHQRAAVSRSWYSVSSRHVSAPRRCATR